MKNLTINDTPVRTSNNFQINNITLEDLEIPTNLRKFENAEIICKNSKIESDFSSDNLTYGNGDVLEENVKKCANHRVKLTTSDETIKINYTFDDNNLSLINNIDIFAQTFLRKRGFSYDPESNFTRFPRRSMYLPQRRRLLYCSILL